ncbi:MAG: DUF4097 family beta strand repeat-containing protein [Nocardioides sp.]
MNRSFETHQPVNLYVEIGKGEVSVTAAETTESHVRVEGTDADEVSVTYENNDLRVIAPRRHGGLFGGEPKYVVDVTVPVASNLATKTGSADISTEGQLAAAQIKTGSGDCRLDTFTAEADVETGSGDVSVAESHGDLLVKSGSGDVSVGTCLGELAVSTGSGDVEVGTSNGPVRIKTGSGDLKVVTANSDVSLATGSGDLSIGTARRGRHSAKGASGDVRIGIPAGTPVWTDITTVTGDIRNHLESVGAPAEGQDHVELQAKTVSGDITLVQV